MELTRPQKVTSLRERLAWTRRQIAHYQLKYGAAPHEGLHTLERLRCEEAELEFRIEQSHTGRFEA